LPLEQRLGNGAEGPGKNLRAQAPFKED